MPETRNKTLEIINMKPCPKKVRIKKWVGYGYKYLEIPTKKAPK